MTWLQWWLFAHPWVPLAGSALMLPAGAVLGYAGCLWRQQRHASQLLDDIEDNEWADELHGMVLGLEREQAAVMASQESPGATTVVFPTHVFPAAPEPTRTATPATIVRAYYTAELAATLAAVPSTWKWAGQ